MSTTDQKTDERAVLIDRLLDAETLPPLIIDTVAQLRADGVQLDWCAKEMAGLSAWNFKHQEKIAEQSREIEALKALVSDRTTQANDAEQESIRLRAELAGKDELLAIAKSSIDLLRLSGPTKARRRAKG